jgi:hypothetical protein
MAFNPTFLKSRQVLWTFSWTSLGFCIKIEGDRDSRGELSLNNSWLAIGMGHGASGIGHWAWVMGDLLPAGLTQISL